MTQEDLKELVNEFDIDCVQIKDGWCALVGFNHEQVLIYDKTKLQNDYEFDSDSDEDKPYPIIYTPCTYDELPEGTRILEESWWNPSVVGVTETGQAVYDYELMCDCYMKEHKESDTYTEDYTPRTAAEEWIGYNVLRSLPYFYDRQPVILYDFAIYE